MYPIPNVDNFPNFNNLVFMYLFQPALLINCFKVNSITPEYSVNTDVNFELLTYWLLDSVIYYLY